MRLDKYLKVSRLIKRRTVAKELVDAGRVKVNGKVAKPGHEVRVGDQLEIGFGPRQIAAEILAIRENVRAEEAADLYRLSQGAPIE
ncbi:MAG: RNA-binding S4 domain-containing protein [Peptococcaceae bacterium]|jgi:ribosomal 50S subunit-recycling heat shock protein|nr:RNA-binding S4 domain-containing protein [Peptococcaceae bacterium]